MQLAIQIAKEQNVIVIFRTTNPRGVQFILKGHPPKGKDLIAMNTDKITGKVTAVRYSQRMIAMKEGYYILTAEGYAYNRLQPQKFLLGADGKRLKFDMQKRGQYGELTNRPGQVIEPTSRKAVVGDYDLQDVILPGSQGRQIAPVPTKVTGDVQGSLISRYRKAFNEKLKSIGDKYDRIVHGADAQFMQYRSVRNEAFRGDAFGILPDGKVVYFSPKDLVRFYSDIGRSRLTLPEGTKLEPYKKD